VAVGESGTGGSGGGYATLTEQWDGSQWAIRPSPNPLGRLYDDTLTGVACTSASACTAVGPSSDQFSYVQVTLAERWDGSIWKTQPTPAPLGLASSQFAGVACSAPSACVAVGTRSNSASHSLALAESWDGSAWTFRRVPQPRDAWRHRGGFSVLSGVACSSAAACTAVGYYVNNAEVSVPLVERWDGVTWTVQPTPTLPGAPFGVLSGVSCPSLTNCVAAGRYAVNYTSPPRTLIERWDGTTWTMQASPTPAGANDVTLAGVSCVTPGACTAVGSSASETPQGLVTTTLAERWDGTAWTIQPTPNGPPIGGRTWSHVDSVSCADPTSCTAIGTASTDSGDLALAEHWDGTAWTIQPIPDPSGALLTRLHGIACASSTACVAVGSSYSNSTGLITLAERWDGSAWTIESTPSPLYDSELNGVSCSPSFCTAVGDFLFSGAASQTLVEHSGH
jgi:hypothetical protein